MVAKASEVSIGVVVMYVVKVKCKCLIIKKGVLHHLITSNIINNLYTVVNVIYVVVYNIHI